MGPAFSALNSRRTLSTLCLNCCIFLPHIPSWSHLKLALHVPQLITISCGTIKDNYLFGIYRQQEAKFSAWMWLVNFITSSFTTVPVLPFKMSRKVKTSYQGNGNKENISHLVWNRKLLMKMGKGISVKMLHIKSEVAHCWWPMTSRNKRNASSRLTI